MFTNYGIIRPNGAASDAATGTTQMEIYVGVFSGPLMTGPIIEAAGCTAMWPVGPERCLVVSAKPRVASVVAKLVSASGRVP